MPHAFLATIHKGEIKINDLPRWHDFLKRKEGATLRIQEVKSVRTESQNNALWLFMTLLADSLNDMGLEPRKVLKPEYNFRWTKEMIHDCVWIPIQQALYGTESTRDLKKLEQIEKIHEIIMREFGEKHQVEFIPFPSDQTIESATGARIPL